MNRVLIMMTMAVSCMNTAFAQDSVQVLRLPFFIEMVRSNHPVARQATIQVEQANAALLSAKGAFDPAFYYEGSRKTFNDKNYYFYSNPEVKVPLPVGNVKAGLESNGGQFLTSESTPGRTSYLGVEVPLGKGLLTDKRRTALQQARIFTSQSVQQQKLMMNDLLLEAYTAYYQWTAAYRLYNVYTQSLANSEKRLSLVRTNFANGDRSAMDTAEAYVQLLNVQLLQNEAVIKAASARFELSNYVWDGNKEPLFVKENTLPDTAELWNKLQEPVLNELLQKNTAQNPQLLQYQYKLNALEADRKLKQQSLWPEVNVKANLLNKDYYVLKDFSGALLQNNYKWGVDVKIPLLFREGRGEYRKAKLKIEETNLDLQQKRLETQNKISDYYNQYTMLKAQLQQANTALAGYNSLLRNENLRFTNGESSLFMVNSRENKVLEMQQKITELQVKFFKARYALEWAAGLLK